MPYMEQPPKLLGSGYGMEMYLIGYKQEGQCVSMYPGGLVHLVGPGWTAKFESRSTHNAIKQAKDCVWFIQGFVGAHASDVDAWTWEKDGPHVCKQPDVTRKKKGGNLQRDNEVRSIPEYHWVLPWSHGPDNASLDNGEPYIKKSSSENMLPRVKTRTALLRLVKAGKIPQPVAHYADGAWELGWDGDDRLIEWPFGDKTVTADDLVQLGFNVS